MRRQAESPSKYITNVPATASGVPAHLLSPQSSSDDLCIGYQSQKLLNWVETIGAGEEGGVRPVSPLPLKRGWWQKPQLLSLTLEGRTLRYIPSVYPFRRARAKNTWSQKFFDSQFF